MKRFFFIQNFWVHSKENKKELIIWGIIVFLITQYMISPAISYLWDKLSPKPEVVINITSYRDAEISHDTKIKDSYLVYFLGEHQSMLMFISKSQLREIREYGEIISPTQPICDNCAQYGFSVKNIGNKRADKVTLDIKSSSLPEILFDSPKMIKKDCGGYFEGRGCYIVLEGLDVGEEVKFTLFFKNAPNAIIPKCRTNNKFDCLIQYLDFLVEPVDPEKDLVGREDLLGQDIKWVHLPTLKDASPNTLFWYKPSVGWTPITTSIENATVPSGHK